MSIVQVSAFLLVDIDMLVFLESRLFSLFVLFEVIINACKSSPTAPSWSTFRML